ncbi:MAG TPA: DinB family protein [Candidatus Acidoferrum sp.]|nr:DinB family protein [Candidatus Acidoferrum sp.]
MLRKADRNRCTPALLTFALGLALAPSLVHAQAAAPAPSANPVSDALRQSLARASKNMTAAAEAMPAEKFSFKPTAPEMTYGHLVVHIAETNFRFCSAVSGTPSPEQPKLTETDSKDKLVAAVRSSFDFCSSSLAKLDDTHLADSIELFGGHSFSRAASMFILAGSWADHYSAQSIYLRLNNLLPPSAQPQK